jgi:hypothetical protein
MRSGHELDNDAPALDALDGLIPGVDTELFANALLECDLAPPSDPTRHDPPSGSQYESRSVVCRPRAPQSNSDTRALVGRPLWIRTCCTAKLDGNSEGTLWTVPADGSGPPRVPVRRATWGDWQPPPR